jgi:cyclopropane fatty-acyl-phospholipid synthase-like methyltransferase
MQGFAYAKPHGYAGDFEMIERIYNRSISTLDFVHKWDMFFHETPAADAVRNRAILVRSILDEERPESLLSVGCGPGLDVRDAFAGNEYLQHVDFLDNDEKAIARSKINNAWAQGTSRKVGFFVKNALRFRPTTPYDLVWSSGLFDYLNDNTFLFLFRRLKEMISAKGKVVIGNFSDNNASRPYMECIGSWVLIHRSADDLLRLAKEAGFSPSRTHIIADGTNINLFLIAENDP